MKIERGCKVFVDTNVLLEATDQGRPLHEKAWALFQNAPEHGIDLFFGTQVVREYLVVATRPVENNGLGMNPETALENIIGFRRRASLIAETLQAGEVFIEWVGRFEIRGKKLHDLQLLATASVAGMGGVITANAQDFPKSTPLVIIPLSEFEW